MRGLSLLVLAIAFSGCSNKFKKKVGIVTSGPNEYQVQKYKPLDVPPHYNLPEPTSATLAE